MTTTLRHPALAEAGPDPTRKTSMVAGVLFVITFITSIPALVLYQPVLHHTDYIVGAGADNRVLWGAFLEVLLVIANIGTAVALFPVVKRQHEGFALGFVAARVMESVFIVVGILSVVTIVTLRQDSGSGGTDAASLITVGKALVAVKDWTFLLGPGFVVGVGNGLILGYLMYRSGLVPRRLAVLGLIGGPLICTSGAAVLFGLIDAGSVVQGIATVPEFIWELSLGIYLMTKGFRPSPVTAGMTAPAASGNRRIDV